MMKRLALAALGAMAVAATVCWVAPGIALAVVVWVVTGRCLLFELPIMPLVWFEAFFDRIATPKAEVVNG